MTCAAVAMTDPMKVPSTDAAPSSESGDSTAPSTSQQEHSADSSVSTSTSTRPSGESEEEDEAIVASKVSGKASACKTLLSAQAKPFKIGESTSLQHPLHSSDQLDEVLKYWDGQGSALNMWGQEFEGIDPCLWALPPWCAMLPLPLQPFPPMDGGLFPPLMGTDVMAEQTECVRKGPPSPTGKRRKPKKTPMVCGTYPSRGSKNHDLRMCRPCRNFNSPEGCSEGALCNFCHCEHDESQLQEANFYSAKALQRKVNDAKATTEVSENHPQREVQDEKEARWDAPMYVPVPSGSF